MAIPAKLNRTTSSAVAVMGVRALGDAHVTRVATWYGGLR